MRPSEYLPDEAASPENAGAAADAFKLFRRGEVALAFGLGFLALATGLYPSVMVWLLGLFFVAPVAVILLLFGVLGARGPDGSGPRRAAGLLLLACGLGALFFAALGGSAVSYKLAVPQASAPALWTLPWVIVLWVLPVFFIGPGLRFWTDWSPWRRRAWCAVVLLVPLVTLFLHRTLGATGLLPLSA